MKRSKTTDKYIDLFRIYKKHGIKNQVLNMKDLIKEFKANSYLVPINSIYSISLLMGASCLICVRFTVNLSSFLSSNNLLFEFENIRKALNFARAVYMKTKLKEEQDKEDFKTPVQ